MRQLTVPAPLTAFFASLRQRWRRLGTPANPSTRMFSGIQRRLILWYSGVLAAILIVAGTLLYVGMQSELFGPVDTFLTSSAQVLSSGWQADGIPPCLEGHAQVAPYVACFSADGSLVGASGPASQAPGFLTASLAKTAIQSGGSQDSIDAGNGLGAVGRYALAVRDPKSGQLLGVVQVGISIEGENRALSTLRTLLLLVGALTLGGASIGGWLLARRALTPARLAYSRQQAFIADASHELRTPLTLMRADAEMLLRGRERMPPEDTALLTDLVGETEHLAALTDHLLTLARLDSGSARREHDVVDLTDLAEAVARRTSALAAEKHVTLRQKKPDQPILVIGDQRLLEQALLILVDNAIKYNVPQGTVTVRTYRQGVRACVSVRDTGVGIAPEHLNRLGERFYRPDRARSRETGGTGLGLSIAFGVARSHHGVLTLTSTPEKGTTATIALPAAQASGA